MYICNRLILYKDGGIYMYVADISKLINNKYEFYAHLDKENGRKEKLCEHISLCNEYLVKLIKKKHLNKVLKNIEEILLKGASTEERQLFDEMWMNIVNFHDIGKINPIFQSQKMGNKLSVDSNGFSCEGSNHSKISAALYLNNYFERVEKIEGDLKGIVRVLMFVNSYIIAKHHSSLDDFSNYIDKLCNEEICNGEYINIFKSFELGTEVYTQKLNIKAGVLKSKARRVIKTLENMVEEDAGVLYTYSRLMYSVLVACDYYGTTEFMSGVKTDYFGNIDDVNEFYDVFKKTEVNKKIRDYQKNEYGKANKDFKSEKNINVLRTELFLESEENLIRNIDNEIFFLEAPTGSGKSNTAMNLSFKIIERIENIDKIVYVYPFNTLVEQNINILKKMFKNNEDVLNKIAVINSITPIKMKNDKRVNKVNDDKREDEYVEYAKALLNRQFLNYPMILTTHVSLFDNMFSGIKENIFAFYQLANSVIVLDEIQSYKNSIWTEIIYFLKIFAKVMNIKIIIMSATLPNLDMLILDKKGICYLINDREKYFLNPMFKDRVEADYTLLKSEDITEDLYEHIKGQIGKKILIEFISKKSAKEFHKRLREDEEINCEVLLITGEDNRIERNRILSIVERKESVEDGIILVATQVIEAGVDVDFEIGYKDISKLDSEEQFIGRINRSSMKNRGIVYFFDMDKAESIYNNDLRIEKPFTLMQEEMREIYDNKNYGEYYRRIMEQIKIKYNDVCTEQGFENFTKECVAQLNYIEVSERMRLIDSYNERSVYFARVITDENGNEIDGVKVWEEYKAMLKADMDYAVKRVKLSEITSKLNYFIYKLPMKEEVLPNEIIGELYYIEDGGKYFVDGKLDIELLRGMNMII